MNFTFKTIAISAALACASVAFAQAPAKPAAPAKAAAAPAKAAAGPLAGQTVKIALIDPQSGLMGPVGLNQLKSFQFFADKFSANNPAGVKFELVGFDNKLSPAESLNALKAATDQGIRYITQGNGSSVAGALIDAVNKHNERNPGKEIVFLNYAAVDPDFTNSKCSYWHFRFDADSSMKMEALVENMKGDTNVKNVYLLNQNYSHGHQVAKFAKEIMARKTPSVKVVGEELHPLAQVRDFAPYIAKIKASGADTVITGNWGSDLALLVKAANEGGYTGKFYTYYTGVTGTPTALGSTMEGKVKQIAIMHYNMPGEMGKWQDEFKAKFQDDMYTGQIPTVYNALSNAMAQAKSTEPAKVAAVLSGMKFKNWNGDVEMRKTDHQLQQPMQMTVWQKAGGKFPNVAEKTNMTLAPIQDFPAYIASTPTSCQMKRP
ncbi:branched-chain amino acid ABC transporter substrate-binding protein [Variovorax sp. PCZ-1]|uniref:branched-chain amino acid ABC transporter substrate-binding protein n=1 Tax=Variovorax sp. PCZ-1 TaxID=2835533 RepID=UPI001BD1AECE|nr:branched-chain amino acid ABC transporter substrate-binding protein [Variovorax sp. PCZ-1]MBS7807346.1 branched-chain amino acid ABC transporter substrate-binding protein [Variovorax sp. PCZ-1]